MRAGCAARSFFQFLIGYSEIEKVDDVFSTVVMLVMETAPAPAPRILDRCRFGQNPRTAATQYYIGTLHGGHAQRTWVDLNVKNPKAPVVTREVEDGLGAGQTVNHR
jgi:hypothetical protein